MHITCLDLIPNTPLHRKVRICGGFTVHVSEDPGGPLEGGAAVIGQRRERRALRPLGPQLPADVIPEHLVHPPPWKVWICVFTWVRFMCDYLTLFLVSCDPACLSSPGLGLRSLESAPLGNHLSVV